MNASRGPRRFVVIALSAFAGSAPLGALADPSPASMATAEVLFREGKALLAQKNYASACAKLVESQRLDPGTGTLLTVALCHEGQGKIATAAAEFHDALEQARVAGREDRITMASEHLAALEPNLSRLVLHGERGSGVRVQRDGEGIGEGALDTAVPIDPGEHVVEASAPNKQTWTQRFTVSREPRVFEFRIPELAPSIVGPELPPPAGESGVAPHTSSARIAAYAIGGTGIAAAIVGSVFGIQAISKAHDARDRCPGGLCDDPSALAENEDAKSAATRANIFVGTGAALLVGSAVLWLTEPEAKTHGVGASVGPKGGLVRWTTHF